MGNDVAEAYMAVRAAEYGLAKAKKELDAHLEQWRKANGVRGGLDTSLGAIDVRHSDAKIVFTDQAALLAWAKVNAAHEVVAAWTEEVEHPEQVRESLPKWLAARCKVVGGQVVDTTTGEILAFASVEPAKDVLAARLSTDAKERAAEAVMAQLDTLLDMVAAPARAEIAA